MRATLRWASGWSPRNVTFQSARPPDKATGRRDKVLELLLFKKSSHLSKFSELQLFSIKSTNRRNYWDECHVEMVIRPGSLNFYFSTGSAAGLRDDVCLLLVYTDYIARFCEVIFVRDNVFIMFPWFKWILHLNLSTKVNFLVKNTHVSPGKSLCTEYPAKPFSVSENDNFIKIAFKQS